MNRRQLLSRAGAAAAAALAGCGDRGDEQQRTTEGRGGTGEPSKGLNPPNPPNQAGPRERYADRFESMVDVGEFDVATDASESILPFLREHLVDDTVAFFPEGRYLLPDTFEVPSFENVGLVGDGATFVPPDGYSSYLFALGHSGKASGLVFEGFTFDFTAADTGARPIQALVDDGLEVRDVTVRGVQDTGQDVMRFDVTAPGGSGLVERLRLPDGGVPETPATGCFVGPLSEGTLTFHDCYVEGFPDNGLYASPAKGPVRVLGGTYRNNGIANVRVGTDSLVRGVHVRCDEARQGVENMRGIRLRQGANARVENCVVELHEVTNSDGAITVSPWLESATVKNTRVTVNADGIPAIRLKTPVEPGGGPRMSFRGVHVDGSAAGGEAVQVIDRDACVFEDVCIRQNGRNRDGVRLIRSRDSVVRDAAIGVTGEPLVLEDSTAETVNVATFSPTGHAGATGRSCDFEDGRSGFE
jgi:hypothetical protein